MMKKQQDRILIEFLSNDKNVSLSVHLDTKDDTVWLTLAQISQLFQRDRTVISKHIKNALKNDELEQNSTTAFFAVVQNEGDRVIKRDIEHFNLDVILSVGYRVNSKKGTEFRQWASRVLKEHLIKGYSFNENRLLSTGMGEIDRSLELLKQSLISSGHISNIGSAAIEIIRSYTKSWLLLNAFDENRLPNIRNEENHDIIFTYELAMSGISQLKSTLIEQSEATALFGNERQDSLKQIIGSIHQTFAGELLYPSIHERAAHLFYFTIKDHPFTDGNKRIGSFFLLFYLSHYAVPIKLSNEALVALALFVAQSQPSDKEIIIKLILNLITKE